MTGFNALPVVLTIEPGAVIASPITAFSLASADKLLGTSVDATKLPAATILVERNSSPTMAVSAGIIIGNTSSNVPVLTNNVVLPMRAAGIPVLTPAATAVEIIPANDVNNVCASVSSVYIAFTTCVIGDATEFNV